jgi:hypothetical protein
LPNGFLPLIIDNQIMQQTEQIKMIKLFCGCYHKSINMSSNMQNEIKLFYRFNTLMLYHFNALTLYHFNTLSLYLVKVFSTQRLKLLTNFTPSPYGGVCP